MIYLDKNYGNFTFPVGEYTVKTVSLTDVTLSNTFFDHANSACKVSAPSDIAVNLAGLNTTASFGFSTTMDWPLSPIVGTIVMDITGLSVELGTGWTEVNGVPQINVTSSNFVLGTVDATVNTSKIYKYIINELIGTAEKSIASLISTELAGLATPINAAFNNLTYVPEIYDGIVVDLY